MNGIDRGFGYHATLDPESNCTLEMYAAAKALPVDFFSSLGLATTPTRTPRGDLRWKSLIGIRTAICIASASAQVSLKAKAGRTGGCCGTGGPRDTGPSCMDLIGSQREGPSSSPKERVTPKPFGCTALQHLAFLVRATSSLIATTSSQRP